MLKILNCLKFPRKPDFTVTKEDGGPYLLRWYVIPQNKTFNIYFHKFMASDDDRALHDHRAHNISILLKGSYIEHIKGRIKVRRFPCVVFRRAETPHRIQLFTKVAYVEDPNFVNSVKTEVPAWSLFIKLHDFREWGFHCPKGWRHWKEFVMPTKDGNKAGRGCD